MTPHDGNERDNDTEIVPYGKEPKDDGRGTGPNDLITALIWCGLGSVAITASSVIGAAMVAYGASFGLARHLAGAKRVLVAAASVAGLVLGWFWEQGGVAVLGQSVVALAVAWAVGCLASRGRANVTTDYAAAALAAVALAAIDFAVAFAAGIDPAAAVGQAVSGAVEEAASTYGLEVAAQLRQLSGLIVMVWPFGYFAVAGVVVLASHYGGFLGRFRPGDQRSRWRPSTFDAPAWSVVALIAGIALAAFGSAAGPWATVVQGAGLTVLLAVRFIFLMEGYGVLTWWLRERHVGCALRFVIFLVLIDLEAMFFVVSILGLVDFWANFRHLPRGSATNRGNE